MKERFFEFDGNPTLDGGNSGLFTRDADVQRLWRVGSRPDPRSMTMMLAETAARIVKAETLAYTSHDPETGEVVFESVFGKHSDALTGLVLSCEEAGPCCRALLAGKTVVSANARKDPRVRTGLIRSLGIKTLLSVPILSEERLIGSLTALDRTDGAVFTAKDASALESIARFAAVSLGPSASAARGGGSAGAETVLDSIHDGLIFINRDGVITQANRAISECFPMKPGDLLGANVWNFVRFGPLAEAFAWNAKARPGSRCWEVQGCARLSCPVHGTDMLRCWSYSAGRGCGGCESGRAADRRVEACLRCVVLEEAARVLRKPREAVIMGKVFQISSAMVIPDSGNGEFGEVMVFRDITSQKLAESRHTEFVSMMTHDLKAPLTSILGYLELSSDQGDIGRIKEMNQAAADNSARMLRMINEILYFSRAESGHIAPEPVEIPPGRFLDETMKSFIPQAEAKGVRLGWETTPGTPPVLADRDHLFRIIGNLVSNALSFTGEDGWVNVEARPGPVGYVAICVKDNGPGMDEKVLRHVFDKYYTGSSTGGGAGLGLSIVKMLTEAQGGSVSVESEKGVGSAFTILLPSTEKDGHSGAKGASSLSS